MFPQLIAGPIVRYETIEKELKERKLSINEISLGIQRFVIGLAKKVMLADLLGELSQRLSDSAPSFLGLWLRALADTLQLYFDFSGYSDMAIGLGLILGFHFLENFNYPLIARSITDFWRRWHISLSSWFRDYLYIPLGGNRVSKHRYVFNLFCVWIHSFFEPRSFILSKGILCFTSLFYFLCNSSFKDRIQKSTGKEEMSTCSYSFRTPLLHRSIPFMYRIYY